MLILRVFGNNYVMLNVPHMLQFVILEVIQFATKTTNGDAVKRK